MDTKEVCKECEHFSFLHGCCKLEECIVKDKDERMFTDEEIDELFDHWTVGYWFYS